jgi:TPR repeat protein
MYERALSHRDFYTYYCLGRLYTFDGIMGLKLDKALDYFNKGYAIFPDDYGFCNMLGEIYFHGKKDYDMAFYYLNKANELGSLWGADMLGTCYLYGLGTYVDAQKARQLFKSCPKKHLAISGIGKSASN